MNECMYVCMSVCKCVYIYACVYVFVYVFMYAQILQYHYKYAAFLHKYLCNVINEPHSVTVFQLILFAPAAVF